MAQIVGAGFTEEDGWSYSVIKPGTEYSDEVKEDEVLFTLLESGKGWKDVNVDSTQSIRI